ncbi:MAG: GlsB/YeaQ/YmgE family stress response membrane protein [Thermomicrobiales bacterium]
MGFISWIIVGLAAGWLAGLITGTKDSRGLLGNLILGLVGAFVAGLFTNNLVGGNSGLFTSIIVAAAVAAILVVIKNALVGRSA